MYKDIVTQKFVLDTTKFNYKNAWLKRKECLIIGSDVQIFEAFGGLLSMGSVAYAKLYGFGVPTNVNVRLRFG